MTNSHFETDKKRDVLLKYCIIVQRLVRLVRKYRNPVKLSVILEANPELLLPNESPLDFAVKLLEDESIMENELKIALQALGTISQRVQNLK